MQDASGSGPVTVDTTLAPEAWDALVGNFADAAHEQTQAYRGAVWGSRRIKRVAVLRGGEVIGLALAVTVLAGPLRRGIAYVKFGPLWRRKGKPSEAGNLSDVLAALTAEFVDRQRLCLNILPAADPRYASLQAQELEKLGYGRRALADANRYLVNVTLDQERQRASLAQKWRYNLKKALAEKLSIGIEEGEEPLAGFDRMFSEMEKRKNYQNDSWALAYQGLKRGFPAAVRPSLVIVRENGNPIAGAVIGHIGDTAHYLYGATTDRATELKAGYAMHWWIMNWLHASGLSWYDLGGEAFEQGLRQFKKGMIGRDGLMAPLAGEFSLCRDPISRAVTLAISGVRGAKEWKKRVASAGLVARLKPGAAAQTETSQAA